MEVDFDRSGYTGQKIQKEEEEELYYYLQSTPAWVFISYVRWLDELVWGCYMAVQLQLCERRLGQNLFGYHPPSSS